MTGGSTPQGDQPTRVLVTGGAGFVGSHLVDALVHAGSTVAVLDDLSSGRRENLTASTQTGRVTLIVSSVTDDDALDGAMRDAELVFHLASPVGLERVLADTIATVESIVRGTERVLASAAEHGVRVVMTSSSEVYGPDPGQPSKESDRLVLGPPSVARWAYASAKLAAEHLCMGYSARGLAVTVARLFNAVGPRQTVRQGMVLPRFVSQALRGQPVTVYGSGEQERAFCDVRDTAAGLLELARCPAATGAIVNVGSDEVVTINELAERVQRTLSLDVQVERMPYKDVWGPDFEDIISRCPDLTLLRSLTGFRPSRSLESTIVDLASELRTGPPGVGLRHE